MVERQGVTVARRARAARAASEVTDSPYLEASRAIARELADTAVHTDAGVTWVGDELVGTSEATLRVVRGQVGPDFYSGTAGIGWFLAHLGAATGDRQTSSIAVAALRSALAGVRSPHGATPSLFSGLTGVAWAALDASERVGRRDLRRSAVQLARRVGTRLQQQREPAEHSDLLAGLAGVVIGLLAVHERSPEAEVFAAAQDAARRLAASSRVDAFGASWPDPVNPEAPALCGLGHGASGVAWALAEADWAAGGDGVSGVVDESLRYERGWFSPERCAWADLREPPVQGAGQGWPAWTAAWCHGAFGIGALRWRLYEKTGDLTALAEASAAIEAARAFVGWTGRALREGQVSDVTLCHGLGGAIELMLLAYEVTGERDHLVAARRAGDLCLSIRAANMQRWTVGLRNAEVVPGLFTGLAGIGVTMLRLHDVGAIASPMLPGRQWAGGA